MTISDTMNKVNDKKIGLGMLSWKGRLTLQNTLQSYQKAKLLDIFDDNVIYFNDISDDDINIANAYGFKYTGGKNVGIYLGMEGIIESLKDADYILFLQQDCPLCELDVDHIRNTIESSVKLLNDKKIDIMRLRSRSNVGEGFSDVFKYIRYYGVKEMYKKLDLSRDNLTKSDLQDSFIKKIRRFIRPKKAKKMIGRAVYVEQNPEKLFPKYISKIEDTYVVSSEVINFTEQPFIISTKLMRYIFDFVKNNPSNRTLKGFQVPEIILNSKWWRDQKFKIGVSEGIFTHQRYDDSFRKEHEHFNASM